MIRKIVEYPDERLRFVSSDVVEFNLGLQVLVYDMVDTMREAGGIGLAAPQIGTNKRVIVIDCMNDSLVNCGVDPWLYAFVNPIIVSRNERFVKCPNGEGCLSLPGETSTPWRSESVTVEAQGLDGARFIVHATGLLAIVFQHEIDHLDGKLMIDA